MLEEFFTDPVVLERLRFGPLGTHMDPFASLLSDQGYVKATAREKIRLAGDLSSWLHQQELGVDGLTEERVESFIQYRGQPGRVARGCSRATLGQLLGQLRECGSAPALTLEINTDPIHRIEEAFAQYLAQERGLAQATLDNYIPFARSFLAESSSGGEIQLNRLEPTDVTGFILRHARTGSPGRAKLMVSALRALFRFFRLRGDIATDLDAAVPTVRNWRLSELPKALEPEQVERLLDACDGSSAIGRRDHAVLLLLARLGLRAGEVAAMTLDDIDWDAGALTVRGKGRRRDRLPIPQDVGEALARYLRDARPGCSTRRVFVRMKAPLRGFATSATICDIVRRALARAGLDPARKGAHLLRHSLATRMLRNGASLCEIGDILRHRLPSTTEIYAKIDLEALVALAQPWPGGGE